MDLNDLTLQRNMIWWWFSWSFQMLVLALIYDKFWHRFHLHFGNLLVLISCVPRHRFLNEFSITFLTDFWTRWFQKLVHLSPPFAPFVDTFPQGVFLKDPCALLASILVPFASLLAPFASLWKPFGSLLDPFGSFWLSMARFWFPNLWQQSNLRKYQAPWPSHPTVPKAYGPGAEPCRRHFDPLWARRRPGRVIVCGGLLLYISSSSISVSFMFWFVCPLAPSGGISQRAFCPLFFDLFVRIFFWMCFSICFMIVVPFLASYFYIFLLFGQLSLIFF